MTKILEVLETVAIYGPATLDEVCRKAAYTRSSVFRALKVLERDGWLHRSLNGRSYTISSRMEKLSDLRFNVSDDIANLISAFRGQEISKRRKITIVAHVRGRDFEVIDSNAFPLPMSLACEDLNEMLFTLVAAMRSVGMLRGPNLLLRLDHKVAQGLLQELRHSGYILSEPLDTAILPILLTSGELVMILAEGSTSTQMSTEKTREFAEDLLKHCSSNGIYIFKDTEPKIMVAE